MTKRRTITQKMPIPDGCEFESFDKATNSIVLKKQSDDVLDYIQTDEDVLADNGHTWDSFNKWCEGLEEDEKALRFIKLLVKSLNQGWVPDFDNSNQAKYEPRFMGGSSGFRYDDFDYWGSYSYVGSRLCLKESRLAIYAGEKFTKWYKQVILLAA